MIHTGLQRILMDAKDGILSFVKIAALRTAKRRLFELVRAERVSSRSRW